MKHTKKDTITMNICQLPLVFCIILFIGSHEVHSGASNSLANCQTVASAFLTTISTTAPNITATAGVNVTCSATGVVCPGTNYSGVCVWQRKLSAVCRNASGVIKIRIQTNGFPPRCASVPQGSFVELNVDFEVNFNPDVSSLSSLNQNLNTVSSISQFMCTLTYPQTVPSASGFVNYGTTGIDTATGVSVDGVMIYSPDSTNDVDPFYPPLISQAESVDTCLAHCQAAGVYHYHIGAGCMVNPPTGSITACASTNCITNIANYSIAGFYNYQTMTVIGMAKDGHTIYGPYIASNTLVTSGFDICNGMFYDSIGNYAYFATSTYPYLVGCFGPGNYPACGPNCTTNGVSSYSMSSHAATFVGNLTSSNAVCASSSSSSSSSTATNMVPVGVRFCLDDVLLLLFCIIVLKF
jgi:hypothetical protein